MRSVGLLIKNLAEFCFRKNRLYDAKLQHTF